MFTKLIDEITFEDVESFCKEWPEGVRVEYKSQLNIKKQIPKIVSSFANTLGGIFLIGVEANKTKNEVIFPIQGIPETPGITEQIEQSAHDGVYPAIMPQIKLVDVPNSNNIVVVVRVDESIQAPHEIQNLPRVYIRTGSITKPYKQSDIDRITYMLKRREDSQIVSRDTLNRIEKRARRNLRLNLSTLTVVIKPVYPYRPVISASDIYKLYWALIRPLRRVEGGVSHIRPREYLELNEYGIVLHRVGMFIYEQEKIDYTIDYTQFILHINDSIYKIRHLYERCEYLGNIEVTVQLRDVMGIELIDPDSPVYGRITDNILGDTKSVDRDVFASMQCLSRDLGNEEKRKDIVEELICQLLWAFNIPADRPSIRERVKERIR